MSSSSISALVTMVQERRELISELVKRELRDRHTGQILGSLWAFGHPLLLMLMYMILFAYVFPARFGSGASIQDYSTCVLAGIVPWLAFQDILSRAPSVFIIHANLVKQIVFPMEVLPVKAAIASAVPYLVGLLFTIGYAEWHGTLSWFALTIPAIALCQFAAMIGVSFLLSGAGVFLRDLRDVIQVFCTFNLFAQPILYNPNSIPHWMHNIFLINPFSYLIWCWQDALYFGRPEHLIAWIVFPVGSILVLILGWVLFQNTRYAFGDSL